MGVGELFVVAAATVLGRAQMSATSTMVSTGRSSSRSSDVGGLDRTHRPANSPFGMIVTLWTVEPKARATKQLSP
jgi:hypothetical protein